MRPPAMRTAAPFGGLASSLPRRAERLLSTSRTGPLPLPSCTNPLPLPSRTTALLGTLLLLLPALAGCEREMRRLQTPPPSTAASAAVPVNSLRAGPAASGALDAALVAATASSGARPAGNPYEDNAYEVAEGKRLYTWFNCSGCHGSGGGGGMGPALIDAQWIYGAEPADIVTTLLEGRPNGMPSFAGRLTDQQVWRLAAYVRSMSGQLRTDVAPSRKDGLSTLEPELRRERLEPRAASAPQER